MNRRLPLFVGIGVLVLTVLVFMFLYSPKKQAVDKARSDVAAAQAQQGQLEVHLAELLAVKQQAQETNVQLQRIATQIPPTEDMPGLIRQLKLASDKVGVDLTAQANGSPAPAVSGTYSTLSIGVTVSGNFFQIVDFLNQLETLPRLMKVNTVAVESSGWPILALSASVEAYTTDISAGPGSAPGPQGGTAMPETAPPAVVP